MDLALGKVTEIVNPEKFIIKFTIEDSIEDAVAYPIDTFDELNIGDPILIYGLDTIFGMSFIYQKQRLFDHTRLKLGDQLIDIMKDRITISSGIENFNDNGNLSDSDPGLKLQSGKGRVIEIDSNGDVVIHSGKNAQVKIDKDLTIKVRGDAKINVTGRCNIKSTDACTIRGKSVSIKGTTNQVTPTGTGPFCAIKTCPLTGMPHVGDTVM